MTTCHIISVAFASAMAFAALFVWFIWCIDSIDAERTLSDSFPAWKWWLLPVFPLYELAAALMHVVMQIARDIREDIAAGKAKKARRK